MRSYCYLSILYLTIFNQYLLICNIMQTILHAKFQNRASNKFLSRRISCNTLLNFTTGINDTVTTTKTINPRNYTHLLDLANSTFTISFTSFKVISPLIHNQSCRSTSLIYTN